MPSPLKDSNHERRIDSRSRRQFVLGIGAAALLAGCLTDDDSSDVTTDDQNDDTPTPGPDVGTTTGKPDDDTPTPDAGTATAEPDDDTPTPDPDTGTTTAEPDDDGDSGDGDSGSLSRAEARDLLPEEALALRYEPPHDNRFGEFWVAVVGETDATAVRVEAESGGYNEVRPQNGTVEGYLGVPVQVDPAGDAVTVFAVDEDDAQGQVTSSPVPTDDLTTEEAEQAVPPEALAFTYESPDVGDYGSLTIEITEATDAETLIAQPQQAPTTFADRVGDLGDEQRVGAGTTLEVAVDPDGDEVIISASVDGATGEVTRWQGPE